MLYNSYGLLLPGIYTLTWEQFYHSYNFSSRRIFLLIGMKNALLHFKNAGCRCVYIDGSFVTKKQEPGDYDACWDTSGVDVNQLNPIFHKNFSSKIQKLIYFGEFYPSSTIEDKSKITFLDFFQIDKATGNRKGIVQMELRGIK
jgi:hypothetical protein